MAKYDEEEVAGDACFRKLAARAAKPHRSEEMLLLAEVERLTAELVRPLLGRRRLIPRERDALFAEGRAEVVRAPLDWADLIEEMARTFSLRYR